MSKLSPSLKALISAPFAHGGPTPTSSTIREIYSSIAKDAAAKKIPVRPWLTISVSITHSKVSWPFYILKYPQAAATFTLNSPSSLTTLHALASSEHTAVRNAELIREVGLKCISFNGIPRTINCLNAFYADLPPHVQSQLTKTPSRTPTPENIDSIKNRGKELWNSIYAPFEDKLYDKLGVAHPDLPVVILNSHYGPLLSDPSEGLAYSLGRIGTSLVAIACLRAQGGVGPQVLSHVFGLRKGLEDGTWKNDVDGEEEEVVRWLASDEGGEWVLRAVDDIVDGLGRNFAEGKSRL